MGRRTLPTAQVGPTHVHVCGGFTHLRWVEGGRRELPPLTHHISGINPTCAVGGGKEQSPISLEYQIQPPSHHIWYSSDWNGGNCSWWVCHHGSWSIDHVAGTSKPDALLVVFLGEPNFKNWLKTHPKAVYAPNKYIINLFGGMLELESDLHFNVFWSKVPNKVPNFCT